MLVRVDQLVDFSLGLGGLGCDDHVLLASSRFDLDGDLLWTWSSGLVTVVGRDADHRNRCLCEFAERAATRSNSSNSASSVGRCDGWKTTLCWPGGAAGTGSRLVDAGDLTIHRSAMLNVVVPGQVTRGRLTVERRT